ncbi:uncharacterized protein LOC128126460 [Lactuca sativa]|uniref:uncharacterized protein LOC128126460 n=1 Tax=Lactuca sativa TaxID=4236 RepID=UPI0022AEDFCD|nr:uncharacterized protein LOC128126460 [Lactuca sativa]
MSMDNSQTNPINISNSIGSMTRIPILYTQDYEVWTHHFEDYVIGSEDNGYLIWEAITVGPFAHSSTSKIVKAQKENNQLVNDVKDIPQDEKEKCQCNIKALRMIRFALQSDTFRLVSSCATAKEIWDRLKEFYSTDEDLEHSIQTLLLSEFGDFKQKPEEKLVQAFDRFNHLLCKMINHGIERKVIEQKVTFMNGLKSGWMAVVSTVKAHEQFKSYSLAKLVGILKCHESALSKETNVVSTLGSLALVSKGKSSVEEEEELDLANYDLTGEEYAMMVSNPRKFIKTKFPADKNRNWKGSYSAEKIKEEPKMVSKSEESKKETKVGGDSGFDCHYCGGNNHFAKDCMLRKKEEKINEEDEEASLLRRLEEIKKRKSAANNTTMNALIVQDTDNCDNSVVWKFGPQIQRMKKSGSPLMGRLCW